MYLQNVDGSNDALHIGGRRQTRGKTKLCEGVQNRRVKGWKECQTFAKKSVLQEEDESPWGSASGHG